MPEPIIVRDPAICGGVPTIRDSRIMLSAVHSWVGHYGWDAAIKNYPRLADLTISEREVVMTYPCVDGLWPVGNLSVELCDAGSIFLNYADNDTSEFIKIDPSDIPALIVALTEAHATYERWRIEVAEWEAERS